MASDDEGEEKLPDAVLEAEREGPERALVEGTPVAKAGVALLAALVVGVVIFALVLIMNRV